MTRYLYDQEKQLFDDRNSAQALKQMISCLRFEMCSF